MLRILDSPLLCQPERTPIGKLCDTAIRFPWMQRKGKPGPDGRQCRDPAPAFLRRGREENVKTAGGL